MLKQLSDKLKQVFYQGSELKNMIETLQSFRRLAAEEEQQLKENDGKINLKEIFTQLKKSQRMFIFIFCFLPFFCMIPIQLICRLLLSIQIFQF